MSIFDFNHYLTTILIKKKLTYAEYSLRKTISHLLFCIRSKSILFKVYELKIKFFKVLSIES